MNIELLTPDEFDALDKIAQASNAVLAIIGPHGQHDAREVVDKIHQLQAMVMSNAAARAYPERFRVLGGTFDKVPICGHHWSVEGRDHRLVGQVCQVELNPRSGRHEGDHISGPGIVASREAAKEWDFPRPKPWMTVKRSEVAG